MKSYLLTFVLLILGFNLISQKTYFPLVEEYKTWHVIAGDGWSHRTHTYKFEGDTIVDDVSYGILYHSTEEFPINWTKFGFLKEDEDRKVYYSRFNKYDPTYFNPGLIYDFNATTNDTVTIYPPNRTEYGLDLIITGVDSVLVDDIFRKRTWFNCEYWEDNFWIEGIGSNSGLTDVGFYCLIVCPFSDLACVKVDDKTIYPNEYSGSCYSVAIDEFQETKLDFKLVPNPCNDHFKIISETPNHSQISFELYDIYGVKIFSNKLNLELNNVINTSNFRKGFFLYQIYQGESLLQKGRILKY